MEIAWGFVILVLSLVAWLGQTVVLFAPKDAVRFGLVEAESEVEPTYWADIRGEARWDFFVLWTLPVAGLLLIAGQAAWAYFGIAGGGIYLYFGGRGILTRLELRSRGFRVGSVESLRTGYAFLSIWLVMSLITIVVAVIDIEP